MKRLILHIDTAVAPPGSPAFKKTLAALRRRGFATSSDDRPHLAALGRICGEAPAEQIRIIEAVPGVLSVSEDTQKRTH